MLQGLFVSRPHWNPAIWLILGLALTPLPSLAAGGVLGDSGSTKHGAHKGLRCGTCHQETASVAADPAAALTAPEPVLCTRCHQATATASHPVGFRPVRMLPVEFPLNGAGEMTCSSCHDPHAASGASLRRTADTSFCESCHSPTFFSQMQDRGRSLFGRGHLGLASRRGDLLDPASLDCVSCHAEKAPSFATDGSVPANPRRHTMSANHPIGALYQEAISFGGYRQLGELSEEVALPGGRVGCVSCHVAYSSDHGRAPETRAGLCMECHDL